MIHLSSKLLLIWRQYIRIHRGLLSHCIQRCSGEVREGSLLAKEGSLPVQEGGPLGSTSASLGDYKKVIQTYPRTKVAVCGGDNRINLESCACVRSGLPRALLSRQPSTLDSGRDLGPEVLLAALGAPQRVEQVLELVLATGSPHECLGNRLLFTAPRQLSTKSWICLQHYMPSLLLLGKYTNILKVTPATKIEFF